MKRFDVDRGAYTQLGQQLSQRHSDELSAQLAVYQSALINFASEHEDTIKNNPEFRSNFTQMCYLIGVDPLELLLFLSSKQKRKDNFYLALAVRVVEICQETRDLNGGLISLKELRSRFQDSLNVPTQITDDDIAKAMTVLDALGKAFEVLEINHKKWIKFVEGSGSRGISNDHKKIYELCEFMGGYVTLRLLRDNYGWDSVRLKSVMDDMILNGFLWIDNQGPTGEWQFWEPSWISK
ncbi:CIC11C00000003648 [Sungouiella intermedia]|uniref:Vacuolar-sorting protein SNF8 n=1 Tax=Sungouiella intermedia TaxID=45354 RepID=A0A1L0DN37_9ASCO|nr:CIC11C00000003648 [[Candida] intermedia]